MARISRKTINQETNEKVEKAQIYQTALYARLSNEDNGIVGSNSLEIQKRLLMNYLAEHMELQLYKIYSDNGSTGTNFERPAFKEMMDAVKTGKVNCIIVKDLSRFGRNFAETGQYIEQIFPFMGIRFISINDRYDSEDTSSNEGLMVALKNLVNAAYSKDLSKKICSQKKLQQQKGNFIGTFAPYGYRKDPDNKHHLLIDEETAPIVRKIFSWRAKGKSIKYITRRLNKGNILAPMKYRYLKGEVKSKKYKDVLWLTSAIHSMLTKQVYIGHVVQGKAKVASCGSKKIKRIPKEEWSIVKNMHEPIITETLFNEVQSINEERKIVRVKKDDEDQPDKILKGLVICGHCNAKIPVVKSHSSNKQINNYRLACDTRYKTMKSACVPNSISEKAALKTISIVLKKQFKVIIELEQLLVDVEKSKVVQENRKNRTLEKRELNKELLKIKNYRIALYEDYKKVFITQEDYVVFIKEYEQKEKKVKKRLKDIEKEEKLEKDVHVSANQWIQKFNEFTKEGTVTRQMAELFIDHIILYQGKRLEIHLKCDDEFQQIKKYIDCQIGGDKNE